MGRLEVEGDPDGTALMPSDASEDPDATCHLWQASPNVTVAKPPPGFI